jgi:hypothetical protein
MRDELDIAHDRPSRLSRVVVTIATLGVALIATWVFAPLLLAHYAATVSAGPKARDVADQPTITLPAAIPPTIAEPTNTAAIAPPEDDATASVSAPPAFASTTPGFNAATGVPWPREVPSATAAPVTMKLASAGSRLIADSPVTDVAISDTPAAAASSSTDLPEVVPLPRKRPSLTIAARLAVPLPRPRPEVDGDVSSTDLSAFERQVDRMR